MTEKNNYTGFDPKYFVSQNSPSIDDMFDKERKDLLERIDRLEGFISDRKRIQYDNLNRIENDTCNLDSKLYQAKSISPYDHLQHNQIEKELVNLESQKRLENVNAWRDMWLVQKEALELFKSYQQLRQMKDFK